VRTRYGGEYLDLEVTSKRMEKMHNNELHNTFFNRYYYGHQSKENVMDWACSSHG
jgi:hypothetical protein